MICPAWHWQWKQHAAEFDTDVTQMRGHQHCLPQKGADQEHVMTVVLIPAGGAGLPFGCSSAACAARYWVSAR